MKNLYQKEFCTQFNTYSTKLQLNIGLNIAKTF